MGFVAGAEVVPAALGIGEIVGDTVALAAEVDGPTLAEGVEDEGADVEMSVAGFG